VIEYRVNWVAYLLLGEISWSTCYDNDGVVTQLLSSCSTCWGNVSSLLWVGASYVGHYFLVGCVEGWEVDLESGGKRETTLGHESDLTKYRFDKRTSSLFPIVHSLSFYYSLSASELSQADLSVLWFWLCSLFLSPASFSILDDKIAPVLGQRVSWCSFSDRCYRSQGTMEETGSVSPGIRIASTFPSQKKASLPGAARRSTVLLLPC